MKKCTYDFEEKSNYTHYCILYKLIHIIDLKQAAPFWKS